jgi:hypothetical protein
MPRGVIFYEYIVFAMADIETREAIKTIKKLSQGPYRVRGYYSETGFHIGMDRNFVCLWRSHNSN